MHLKSKVFTLVCVKLSHRTGDREQRAEKRMEFLGRHCHWARDSEGIGSAGCAESCRRPGNTLALGFNY